MSVFFLTIQVESAELTYDEKRIEVLRLFDEFIKESPQIQDEESLTFIKKAFAIADKAHEGQFRKTGKNLPYIVHPIAVAKILTTEMGFGKTSVAAALLHDVIEDSNGKISFEYLEKEFGEEVAGIVEGVTKIMEVFDPLKTVQVETFKKFINHMAKDKRIAFIKIADRLHNLRTFDGIKENSQLIKTAEAYDIYAPLAYMLGLHEIKKEIEDLSFRYRFPEEYLKTKEKVESTRDERTKFLNEIQDKIIRNFPKEKLNFQLEITERSLYRAWRITQQRKISFKEIHNLSSIKIVLKPEKTYTEKQQCYSAYAYLTDIFPVKQNKFKDWITNPKSNGFQALIAEIIHNGTPAEIQILTERMNQVSKRGYAHGYENKHTENIYRWVNSVKEILDSKYLTNKEILEIIRPQPGEIYAISPKGDIIILPKGSTVLDYAFQIHTDFGLHFQAAEVNGKIVSYNYVLSNADQVTIFNSPTVEPQSEWINSLASHRNKNILIEYFRTQKRKIIHSGEDIYELISEKYLISDDKISILINKLLCENRDDFFYRIGNETITENEILSVVKPRRSVFGIVSNLWNNEKIQTEHPDEFNPKEAFSIKNLDHISIAKCCKPLKGDSAIIHRIDNNNFIIHRNECEQAKILNSTDGENTAKLIWDLTDEVKFRSTIKFNGLDNKGLLSEMIEIISKEHDMNMSSLRINVDKNTFYGTIELIVLNAESVDSVLKQIRKIKYIKKAYRFIDEP